MFRLFANQAFEVQIKIIQSYIIHLKLNVRILHFWEILIKATYKSYSNFIFLSIYQIYIIFLNIYIYFYIYR